MKFKFSLLSFLVPLCLSLPARAEPTYAPAKPFDTYTPPAADKVPESDVEKDRLTPFDGSGVEKVLAVDIAAQNHENEGLYPRTFLRLGLGVDKINPGYPLLKDDDTFVNTATTNLPGGSLEVVPRWKLTTIYLGSWIGDSNIFISTPMTGGYFEGRSAIQRMGVQPNVQSFKYQMFPLNAALQIGADFWNRVGLHLSYGFTAEILHQNGNGLLDSVSDVFYGESLSVVLEGNVTNNIQLFLRYERRGDKIFFLTTNFLDQVFLAGISIALTT